MTESSESSSISTPEENRKRAMAHISQGYPNDKEAIRGELGSEEIREDAVTVEDLVENPNQYLSRNSNHPHSGRDIAEDIVDPASEKWVEKALGYFRSEMDDYFVSSEEEEEIEENAWDGFEPIDTDPSEYGLLRRILSNPVGDAKQTNMADRATRRRQENGRLRSASEENVREFYDNMTEEQQREFILGTIGSKIQSRLEEAYHNNSVGRVDPVNESDYTAEDYHGNDRFIVLE